MKVIPEEQIRILEKQEIDCLDVHSMMCDYADNELADCLKERIDSHICCCTECNEFRDSYLLTIKLASQLKPQTLSVESQNRLRKALNQRLGLNLTLVS